MKKLIFFLFITTLFQSCEKDDLYKSKNDISGKFVLKQTSSLKSLKKSSYLSIYKSDDSVFFSLDTIKSSRSFYFLISNSGQSDITDIAMTTDNSNFIVTPKTIPLISGINSKNNPTLNQVFSIDVIHGTMINGIGSARFLNMGYNYCNINIQGKTFNGDTVIVKLKANIRIFAEIMAISLYQGKYIYDFSNPDWDLVGCGTFNIREMIMFDYYTINPPVTIKNIGNVDIDMTMISFNVNNPIIQTGLIHPLDSLNLSLPYNELDTREVGGMLRLDSKGTIFDVNKLSKGRDGAAYFALNNPDEFWRINKPPAPRTY
jgi:hypothetical protein